MVLFHRRLSGNRIRSALNGAERQIALPDGVAVVDEGSPGKIRGKAEEAMGGMTGDRRKEAEGRADQARGQARGQAKGQARGQVQGAARGFGNGGRVSCTPSSVTSTERACRAPSEAVGAQRFRGVVRSGCGMGTTG